MNTGKEYRTFKWFLRCNLWTFGFWFIMMGGMVLANYHFLDQPIYLENFHIILLGPAIIGIITGMVVWTGLAFPTPSPMERFQKEQDRAFDAVKYAMNQLPTKELRVEFADNYKKYIDESLDNRPSLG